MKNLVIRTCIVLAVSFIGNKNFAQCPPPGDLEFFHQVNLDEFMALYPNCEELKGNLSFVGADIYNLSSLSKIRKITGNLRLQETQVTSLIGLISLEEVLGNLIIIYNPWLTEMWGLNNLRSISSLEIRGNINLNSLNGLQLLKYVPNNIMIEGPNALVNLNGLNGLIAVNQIAMARNPLLSSLEGLENLKYVKNYLILNENVSLSNILSLHSLEHVGGLMFIQNSLLIKLTGLESLSSIEHTIFFENNMALNNISAISNAVFINPTTIHLDGNINLSNCSILSICEGLTDPDVMVTIERNNDNCRTRAEVEDRCLGGRSKMKVEEENQVEVYPNPNNGCFRINILGENSTVCNLEILSSEGKIVLSKEINSGEIIDLSAHSDGFYTLIVKNENSILTKKIIKN